MDNVDNATMATCGRSMVASYAVINCMRLFWGHVAWQPATGQAGGAAAAAGETDIVCCNIVMTLTMATDTFPFPTIWPGGNHPLMRTLMKHSTMQIAISCRKKQQHEEEEEEQQQERQPEEQERQITAIGSDRSRMWEHNAYNVTNTSPATATGDV